MQFAVRHRALAAVVFGFVGLMGRGKAKIDVAAGNAVQACGRIFVRGFHGEGLVLQAFIRLAGPKPRAQAEQAQNDQRFFRRRHK